MVIVLESAWTNKLYDVIKQSKLYHFKMIKKKGISLFIYVDSTDSFQTIKTHCNQLIFQIYGIAFVYEIYPMYQGMIDRNAYLPKHLKDQYAYYQNKRKDLSKEELNMFLKNEKE